MEKRGVIEPGRTPAESEDKKTAKSQGTKQGTAKDLEASTAKRLSDAVEEQAPRKE